MRMQLLSPRRAVGKGLGGLGLGTNTVGILARPLIKNRLLLQDPFLLDTKKNFQEQTFTKFLLQASAVPDAGRDRVKARPLLSEGRESMEMQGRNDRHVDCVLTLPLSSLWQRLRLVTVLVSAQNPPTTVLPDGHQ